MEMGIDSVIPMGEIETSGRGLDRADCMRQFKTAWERFCADPGRLEDFLDVKRRANRNLS